MQKRANKLRVSPELFTLIRSSGGLLLFRVVGMLCGLTFTILLARTMDQTAVGQVTAGFSLAMLLAMVTTLNIGAGELRFLVAYLAEKDIRRAAGFVSTGRRIALFTSLLILLPVAGVFAAHRLGYPTVAPSHLLLSLIAAVILGWLRLNSSLVHAHGHVLLARIPESLLRPAFMLISLAIGLAMGSHFDSTDIMVLFVTNLALVGLIQKITTQNIMSPLYNESMPDYSHIRDWVKVGIQVMIPLLFLQYSLDTIVVLSARVLSPAEVAILGIILRISGFILFAVSAVDMAVGPRLAHEIHTGNNIAANRLLALSGHLKFWPVLIGCGLLAFFGEWVLGIFGEKYQSGVDALRMLTAIPLILAFFGPTTLLVNILKLQAQSLIVFLISIVILALMLVYLGSLYRIEGVVLSMLVTWFFWNIVLYLIIRVKTGYEASMIGAIRWVFSKNKLLNN